MSVSDQTVKHELMQGADILVKSLLKHDVDVVFAYPGGASMPIHQSLIRHQDQIRTVLPRHEQGAGFGAQGYARVTGKPGICMATSGPGAANLVTTIADAKLDSIPLIAITGQVTTPVIGSDAFQETPTVEVCRGITKHHGLVTDVEDLSRVLKEAFHIATTGRPGPVLIDLPKDVQLDSCVPDWDVPLALPGYSGKRPHAEPEQIQQVAAALKLAKSPVIYCGGGIIASGASQELRELVQKTGMPVVMTLMGLGALPNTDPNSLDMLGMHGSVYGNRAVRDCDLLLALGVRFDDRVTGKLEAFAEHAKIIHIDVDPSELNKNKPAHISIPSDVKYALRELNKAVQPGMGDIGPWINKCRQWKAEFPFKYNEDFDGILQQHAIRELWKKTRERKTIVASGVGQHQMWVAQFYKFKEPRTWLSSGGLGTMGFGLPAAMGAQVACPDATVIDVDGDGSFQMNIQELATCHCENIPVKVLLLNNQHLGMVMQWEDRFMSGVRAHTYLGPIHHAEARGTGDSHFVAETYPDFVTIAKGYGCGAARVHKKEDLSKAMDEMLEYPGPFVLDVKVPYVEHVLPMIPTNQTVDETILE